MELSLILSTKSAFIKAQHDIHAQIFSEIFDSSDSASKRFLSRNRDSLSAWLTATPISKDDFHLSAVEFRDALCLRYMKPLLQLPPHCDGCGDVFTTSHALDCRRGGLVIYRHNEIRDLLFSLSSLVWTQTVKEPIVKDGTSSNPPSDSLIADLGARGVWQPQTTALFDIRIVDTDAPSYLTKSSEAVLKNAEREKKAKYSTACEDRHASFTPLCISVDGLVGAEMKTFLKVLAQKLSTKWDRPYSSTLYWIRTKLSFSLIRATNMCIRGSRSKWRGIGIEDGHGINDSVI